MEYKTIFLLLFGIIVFGLAIYFIKFREKKIEEFQSAPNFIVGSDYIIPSISPDTNFSAKSFSTIYGVQSEQIAFMSSLTTYRGGQLSNFMGYLNEYDGNKSLSNNIQINNVCGATYHNCDGGAAGTTGERHWDNKTYGFYVDYTNTSVPGFPKEYIIWKNQAAKLIDAYTRNFIRTPVWNYSGMCNYINNYSGFKELCNYNITHFGYDCHYSCQLYDNLGNLTSFTPAIANTKNTQIANSQTEYLQVNVYGTYTAQQSNDFVISAFYGSAFNFSNVNNIDMYINVPYFQMLSILHSDSNYAEYDQTFSGFEPRYSYGLFYPEVRPLSQTQGYTYVLDISGNSYNNNLKTNCLFSGILIMPESFDPGITYDANGVGTWPTPFPSFSFSGTGAYPGTTAGSLGPFTNVATSNQFIGPITPKMLSLMPQTQRRYIISFAYNRTQKMLGFFLNNLANTTNVVNSNVNSNLSYNSIIQAAFLNYTAYINQYIDSNGVKQATIQTQGNDFYNFINMYNVLPYSNYYYIYPTDGFVWSNYTYCPGRWDHLNTGDLCWVGQNSQGWQTQTGTSNNLRLVEGSNLFTFSNLPLSNLNISFVTNILSYLPLQNDATTNIFIYITQPDTIKNLYTVQYFDSRNNPNILYSGLYYDSPNKNTNNRNILGSYNGIPTFTTAPAIYQIRFPTQVTITNNIVGNMLNDYNSAIFKLPVSYGTSSNVNIQDKPMLNSIAQYFYDKSKGHYEMTTIYDVYMIGSNMLDIRYDKLQRLDTETINSLEVQYAPQLKRYNTLLNMYFDNTWAVPYSNVLSNYQNDLNLAQSNVAAILNPVYPLSNANPTDLNNTINFLTWVNTNLQKAIEGQPINTTPSSSNAFAGISQSNLAATGISLGALGTGNTTQTYSQGQIASMQLLQDQINTNSDLINSLTNQLTGITTDVARVFYTVTGTNTNTGHAIINIDGMAFGVNAALTYNSTYNASLPVDIASAQGNVNYTPVINYDYNVVPTINCADVDFMKEAAQIYMDGIFNNLSSFTSNVYQQSNGDPRVDGIRGFSNINSNTCGFTWDEVQYDYYTNFANVNRTVNVVIPFKYDNAIYQNPILMIDNRSNGGFSITNVTGNPSAYYPWVQPSEKEISILTNTSNNFAPYITYLSNVKTYGDSLRYILNNQSLFSDYLRNYLFGRIDYFNGPLGADYGPTIINYINAVSNFYPNQNYNYLLQLYSDSNIVYNFQRFASFSNNTLNSISFTVYGTSYNFSQLIGLLTNSYNSNITANIVPQLQSNYASISPYLGNNCNYTTIILDSNYSLTNFINLSNLIPQIPLYNYSSNYFSCRFMTIYTPTSSGTTDNFITAWNWDIAHPASNHNSPLTNIIFTKKNGTTISFSDLISTISDPINSLYISAATISDLQTKYTLYNNYIGSNPTSFPVTITPTLLQSFVNTIANLNVYDNSLTLSNNQVFFSGYKDSANTDFLSNLGTLDGNFLGKLHVLLDPFTYQYNLLSNSGFIQGYNQTTTNLTNLSPFNSWLASKGYSNSFYSEDEEQAFINNDSNTLAIYKTWRDSRYIPILREPLQEISLTNTYGACGDTQYLCSDPLVMGQIMDYYNFDPKNPNGDTILRITKAFTPNEYQCDIQADFYNTTTGVTSNDTVSLLIGQDLDTCVYYIASYSNFQGKYKGTGYFISDAIPYVTSNDANLSGYQYINYSFGGFSNTLSNVFTSLYSNAQVLSSNMYTAFGISRFLTYDALGRIQSFTFSNSSCGSLKFDYNTLIYQMNNNERFKNTFFDTYPQTDSHMTRIIRAGISDQVNRYVEVFYEKQYYVTSNYQTAAAIYQINVNEGLCDFYATWIRDSLPAVLADIMTPPRPLNFVELNNSNINSSNINAQLGITESFQIAQKNNGYLLDFNPILNTRTYKDPSLRPAIKITKKIIYDVIKTLININSHLEYPYNGYNPPFTPWYCITYYTLNNNNLYMNFNDISIKDNNGYWFDLLGSSAWEFYKTNDYGGSHTNLLINLIKKNTTFEEYNMLINNYTPTSGYANNGTYVFNTWTSIAPPLNLSNLSYITGVSKPIVAHQYTNTYGLHVDLYCDKNVSSEVLGFTEQYFSFDLYVEPSDNKIYVLQQNLVSDTTSFYRYQPLLDINHATIEELMSIFQKYYNSIYLYPQYVFNSQIVKFYSYTTPDNTIDQTITFGVSVFYYDAYGKALYNDPTDPTVLTSMPPNVDYLNTIKYFKVKFWQIPQASETVNGTPATVNTNPVFVWKVSETTAPATTNVHPYTPITISEHNDDLDNSKTYSFNNTAINIPNKDCVLNNVYYNYIRFSATSYNNPDINTYQLTQLQIYRDAVPKNAQIITSPDMAYLVTRTNLLTKGSVQQYEVANNSQIAFNLLNPSRLNSYSFVSGYDLNKSIIKWKFEGGFDGTSYFIIDDKTTTNYEIYDYYPSKFYQFPLYSFLTVRTPIVLAHNPIHPLSFGEANISFISQFIHKSIAKSNIETILDPNVNGMSYVSPSGYFPAKFILKYINQGYKVDYTNTISFIGQTETINNNDGSIYSFPNPIEYVITFNDIYNSNSPNYTISINPYINTSNVNPNVDPEIWSYFPTSAYYTYSNSYTNLGSYHIGNLNSIYCIGGIPMNHRNLMNKLVNDLYIHRYDVNQTNNISNTTNILSPAINNLYDSLNIVYVGSNVIENKIYYILQLDKRDSTKLYFAYILKHNFIGDCDDFTIESLEYNSSLTNNIYNIYSSDSRYLYSYIANIENTNGIIYTPYTLNPSLNTYVLSNRDYVRANCFPTFSNTEILDTIINNYSDYIRLQAPFNGPLTEFDFSVTNYKIDYDNFVFYIAILPNYRNFYFYPESDLISYENYYLNYYPINMNGVESSKMERFVGSQVYYYNDYSARDIAYLHIAGQSANPRWYNSSNVLYIKYTLSDTAKNEICSCGSNYTNFINDLAAPKLDTTSTSGNNYITYASNINLSGFTSITSPLHSYQLRNTLDTGYGYNYNYQVYYFDDRFNYYIKTSDLLGSNGLNFNTFFYSISNATDTKIHNFLDNYDSNEHPVILYTKKSNDNLIYSFIINIITYNSATAPYTGDIDFQNNYLELIYNPYHINTLERNDYLFFEDPTLINNWDYTASNTPIIIAESNLSNYARLNGYTKYYSGSLPIVSYESNMVMNFNGCGLTPTSDIFTNHVLSLITLNNLNNANSSFSNLSVINNTSIVAYKDELGSSLDYRYIVKVYDSLSNVYTNNKPLEYTFEWLLHMGPYISCSNIGFEDSFNGLINNYTGYTSISNDILSQLSNAGIDPTATNWPTDFSSLIPDRFNVNTGTNDPNGEIEFHKTIVTTSYVYYSYLLAFDGLTSAGTYSNYYGRFDIIFYSPLNYDSYFFPSIIPNSNVNILVNNQGYVPSFNNTSFLKYNLSQNCYQDTYDPTSQLYINALKNIMSNDIQYASYTKVIGYYENLTNGIFNYVIGLFSNNRYIKSVVYELQPNIMISCDYYTVSLGVKDDASNFYPSIDNILSNTNTSNYNKQYVLPLTNYNYTLPSCSFDPLNTTYMTILNNSILSDFPGYTVVKGYYIQSQIYKTNTSAFDYIIGLFSNGNFIDSYGYSLSATTIINCSNYNVGIVTKDYITTFGTNITGADTGPYSEFNNNFNTSLITPLSYKLLNISITEQDTGSNILFNPLNYADCVFNPLEGKYITALNNAKEPTQILGYYGPSLLNTNIRGSFDYIVGKFSGGSFTDSYVYSFSIGSITNCSNYTVVLSSNSIITSFSLSTSGGGLRGPIGVDNSLYPNFDSTLQNDLGTITTNNYNTSVTIPTTFTNLTAYGTSPFRDFKKTSYHYITFESSNKFFVNSFQLYNKYNIPIKTKLVKKDLNMLLIELIESFEIGGYSFITNSKDSKYNPTSWTLRGTSNGKSWDVLHQMKYSTPDLLLYQSPMFLLNNKIIDIPQPKSYDAPPNKSVDKAIFEKYYKQKINNSNQPNYKKYIYDEDNNTYYLLFDIYDLNGNLREKDLIIGYIVANNKIKKAIMYEDSEGNMTPFDMKDKKMKQFWDTTIALPLVFEDF